MNKVRMGCIALIAVPIAIGALLPEREKTEAEKAAEARVLAQAGAERQVKAALRDPDSAEFRHVKPGVCGYVNSRNGFGGMSGYQRFVIARGLPVLEEQANRPAFEKAWRENC